MENKEIYRDKIRGCMIGGAVGDALGYPVEFSLYDEIFFEYGKEGITEYELKKGVARISDDTQMSLFTANCINFAQTRLNMRGIGGLPSMYIRKFYLDWLYTQSHKNSAKDRGKNGISWLLDIPELYADRAPGITCLKALEALKENDVEDGDYVKSKRNNSKGCGAIMRIAPLGLTEYLKLETIDSEAAQLSAITHCHPLGYIPSVFMAHLIHSVVYEKKEDDRLLDHILATKEAVSKLYKRNRYLKQMNDLIDLAIELSKNDELDVTNISQLGFGNVAEETLAIAIYCSLKYENDFSKGIIASVNHSGDSDSTGAVTGNILGAWLGESAIENKWTDNLELVDIIKEMADDLCFGCQMSEYGDYEDPVWERKYIYGRYK